MGHHERQGVGLGRTYVEEMDGLAVDGGPEPRKRIQFPLMNSPVVRRPPVVGQVLEIGEWDAVLPAGTGKLVGPARPSQAQSEVVEVRLWDLDAERDDGVFDRSRGPTANRHGL